MDESMDLLKAFQRAQRDDALRLFEQIVDQHVDLVYSIARRRLADDHLAADAVQEVFLTLLKKARSLRADVLLTGWLFETTRFVCLAMMRTSHRRARREREVAMNEALPGDDALWSAIAGEVDDAISRLPRRERDLVLLRFFEGHSHREVAGRLGISEDAAKKRLERALETLRLLLTGQGKPVSALALSGVLATRVVQAAPAGTAHTVITSVTAGAAPIGLALGSNMLAVTVKLIVAAVIAATVVPIALLSLHRAAPPIAAPLIPIAASAPAVAPQSRDHRLHVDIVSAAGKPVPDATLCIESLGDSRSVTFAHSDPDGQVAIPAPAETSRLFAFLPGVGISKTTLTTSKSFHLALQPTVDLRIHLLAPDGKPAAGITVHPQVIILREDASLFPDVISSNSALQAAFSATTDATGTCTLRGLPFNSRVRFDTDDDRYAHFPFASQVPLEGATTTIDSPQIRLVTAAKLVGKLLDPQTHAPLAGVSIGAQSITNDAGEGWGQGVTDGSGAFTVGRLSPGTYVLSIDEQPGVERSWTAAALTLAVTEGQTRQADFALTPGGLLTGVVRDAVTKQGVPGVSVGLQGPGRPDTAGAVFMHFTDADGRFRFRVPPGVQQPYFAGPTPEGYLELPKQGMQHIPVAEGQTVDITFDLQQDPSPVVTVTVLDPDEKPAPGATVTVEYPEEIVGMGQHEFKADADGKVKLHARPGALVRARFENLATAKPFKLLDDSPVELRLETKPTFAIVVTILDAAGKPVRGDNATLIHMGLTFGEGGQPHFADASGHVTFSNLPLDGKYSVEATAPGYGRSQKRVTTPSTAGGERAVRLSLAKLDSQVAGTVVDSAHHPLAGITVFINAPQTGPLSVTTDDQGHFSFAVPSNITVDVGMRKGRDSYSALQRVNAGTMDLQLVYSPRKVARDLLPGAPAAPLR